MSVRSWNSDRSLLVEWDDRVSEPILTASWHSSLIAMTGRESFANSSVLINPYLPPTCFTRIVLAAKDRPFRARSKEGIKTALFKSLLRLLAARGPQALSVLSFENDADYQLLDMTNEFKAWLFGQLESRRFNEAQVESRNYGEETHKVNDEQEVQAIKGLISGGGLISKASASSCYALSQIPIALSPKT